jgi:hypothetical protein
MESIISPTIIYKNISRDVIEQDLDVVSDLWNMDGRDVYRGSRDTQYTHANVYWLYDEDFNRVGLVEHSLKNHSDFRILWFYDDPFGTLFQEEGWEQQGSLWELLVENATQRFLAEGWTTPKQILEHCLNGPVRILSPEMVANPPLVYSCAQCHKKSLMILNPNEHPSVSACPLDFPVKSKIIFVDDDLIVSHPPKRSRVFTRLLQHDGDSSVPQWEPVQEPVQEPPRESPRSPPHREETHLPSEPEPAGEHSHPPQEEHPPAQTPVLPSRADQETPVQTRFATSRRTPDPKRRYSE